MNRTNLAELLREFEAVSRRGNTYMRGWRGASNRVAFAGKPDEQGHPTWNLYLVERQQREGGTTAAKSARGRGTGQGVAGRFADEDPDNPIPLRSSATAP